MSLVAIVGRPNVGKSTLFNRLVGMRQAIVDETAGVTRDRHYGKCEWCGNEFSVVDTGGWTTNSDDVFESEIRKQVSIAIEESDLVLFLVEAATGVTDYDAEIADLLRRSRKPVLLVVNKVDSGEKLYDSYQFYSLGLGEVWSISAANGSGTGDLLDEVVRQLPKEEAPAEDDRTDLPHIAIVGKPNVGKSSLTNALLGEDRNIVTPVAGPGVLLGDAFHPCHRACRCLCADDRRHLRHGSPGHEHFQPDPAQPQSLRGGGEQMGSLRQGQQYVARL